MKPTPALLLSLLALACSTHTDRPKPSNSFLLPVTSSDPALARLQAILHHTDDGYTLALHNPNPQTLPLSLDLRIGDAVKQISPPGFLKPHHTETLLLPPLKGKVESIREGNRLIPTLNGDPITLEPRRATPEKINP